MKNKLPDPNVIFPIENIKILTYIKPTIKNPNIKVGEFSYFGDVNFEEHVTHHYDFNGDKLIVGKFCQIAAGVNFIMNGANHKMNSVTTYPFYIFKDWHQSPPTLKELPLKGDTIIGNDVWIGQNVTVMPGVKIGDGAIIGANSTVAKNVEPYTIVAGNPAKFIRKRFDNELIDILEKVKWWDMSIEKIQDIIPILNDSNLIFVKEKLREILKINMKRKFEH